MCTGCGDTGYVPAQQYTGSSTAGDPNHQHWPTVMVPCGCRTPLELKNDRFRRTFSWRS